MVRYVLLSAILTIGIFTMVAYTACTTTDKCASISCNYGTCSDGVCTCYSGYTGKLCDKRTCEANNTARVRFTNKTVTNLTYTIVWDGSTLTTVLPGQTSEYFTVAAAQHTLHFMVSNGTEACTVSSPVLALCQDYEYNCNK
jgi:hypothetical protein